MAAESGYSPASGLRSPSLPDEIVASSRHIRPPRLPKLRDSCDACALSKVKCPKDKPTCARCARRGITCEYVATRRGGRRYDGHRRSIIHAAGGNGSSGGGSVRPSSNSAGLYSGMLLNTHNMSQLEQMSGSSDQSTVVIPSTLNDWMMADVDMDGFLALPVALSTPTSVPRTSSHDDLLDVQQSIFFSSTLNDSGDIIDSFLPTPRGEDADNTFEVVTMPSQSASEADVPNKIDGSCTASGNSETLHVSNDGQQQHLHSLTVGPAFNGCLTHALSTMQQLFPDGPPVHVSSCTTSQTPAAAPTMQTVIARNAQTIEAVSTMLQCSCSQDGFLLSVMSLLMFKVMNWYAAAARPKQGPHSSPLSKAGIVGPGESLSSSSTSSPVSSYSLPRSSDQAETSTGQQDNNKQSNTTETGSDPSKTSQQQQQQQQRETKMSEASCHVPNTSLMQAERIAAGAAGVIGSYCLDGTDSAHMAA